MVCHPSRTFPLKELEREPQNRLPPFSPPLDHTLSYLWPMAHRACIGWVQVGGAWILCMFHSHVSPWLVCYSCVCHCLWVCLVLLHVVLLVFNPLWRGWVWVFILCISFLLWVGSCLGIGLFFFNLAPVSFYFWFVGRLILLPCHCIISTIHCLAVLAGPPFGLPCIFSLLSSCCPVLL